MLKTIVAAVAIVLVSAAHCEELTYEFPDGADRGDCSYKEEKRREIITKYKLPKDLEWQKGYAVNEWKDVKEVFCFLSYGGKRYISFVIGGAWNTWSKSDLVVKDKNAP